MSKEIEQLITKAGVAINNSLQNTELQNMLAEFGYTAERLTKGKALLDNATALNTKQVKEWGEKTEATNKLKKKREQAHGIYIKFVKIARIAMPEEPAAWQALGLWGERKESISGWLVQANQFYTNMLGNQNWLGAMANYGITTEKLTAGETLVKQVEAALSSQKIEMGEAQEATRTRDKAADTLQAWHSNFIAIARIALEDKPQFLEMLGIVKK